MTKSALMVGLIGLSGFGAVLVPGDAEAAGVDAAAVEARSQVSTARVMGRVTDARGEPLRHAQVAVTTTGRHAATDVEGRFSIPGVPAGRHRLEVSLIGYAPAGEEFEVRGGGVVELSVILESTPLSVAGIQVTATLTGRDPRVVTQATSQLSGRQLERELGGTVAQTLKYQPGIAVRYNGPSAALPVMRGLTGDRILMLQDGQRSSDLAGSADDHGVTIDPLAAQRVEVVRGPATLLYGNNALGGVVNVISGDVPTSVPLRTEWSAALQAESVQPGGSGSVKVSAPLGEQWAVTARGGARDAGSVRIGEDPVLGDRLDNTDTRNWNGSVGVGYAGDRVLGGGAFKAYDFEYGIPVPPNAEPIRLRGRRYEGMGRAEVTLGSPLFPSLRMDATAQDYLHDELDEAGEVVQAFALETQTVNVVLRQGVLGPFSDGAWGVSGLRKRYAATGPAALTPAADSRAYGVFGFQELPLGEGGPALQFGARWDRYEIASRTNEKFGPGRERTFRAFSGSAGLRAPLAEGVSVGVSVARSFRAPTVEELFSGAPHAGTGSVEFGDPELEAERGRSIEGVVRVQNRRWNGQFAAYASRISNYVQLKARGDTVVDGLRLPVLVYAQETARLRGLEGALEWAAREDLVLGIMGDVVHGEQVDGTPLSFMPPPRLGASVRWDPGAFSLGGDVHHELRQGRVGPADERPTDAHTILRLTAAVLIEQGGVVHSVTLRAENLANTLHREATSRIKDFAPGPGRNIALLYRIFF